MTHNRMLWIVVKIIEKFSMKFDTMITSYEAKIIYGERARRQ